MITLNGLIVDFICVGGAAILTGLGMGLVLLLTEDRRGRIFMQEIPAKFRKAMATPEVSASDWVKPMHRATPAARQMAAHLAGLGHLLRPKGLSPWRARMLARNLAARATRARKMSPALLPSRTPPLPAAASTTRLHTQLAGATREPGPGALTGPPREPATSLVAAPPAAARQTLEHPGNVRPEREPAAVPLPDLPAEIPAPDCDYPPATPFSDWERDSIVMAAIKDGA